MAKKNNFKTVVAAKDQKIDTKKMQSKTVLDNVKDKLRKDVTNLSRQISKKKTNKMEQEAEEKRADPIENDQENQLSDQPKVKRIDLDTLPT